MRPSHLHDGNVFSLDETGMHPLLPGLIWQITDCCHLSCGFCLAPKLDRVVQWPLPESFWPTFASLGVLKVDLAGGEPLLVHALPEIVDELEARSVAFTLTTSGVATEQSRTWLAQNSPRFARVVVSIDGRGPVHDELRGRAGAFELATSLVRQLAQRNQQVTRINTVMTKPLLRDGELEALADIVEELGVSEWCLIEPFPANHRRTFDSVAVSVAEADGLIGLVEQHSVNEQLRILVRRKQEYAGYWILYPDGMLVHRTKQGEDIAGLPFELDRVHAIKKEIAAYGRWVAVSQGEVT